MSASEATVNVETLVRNELKKTTKNEVSVLVYDKEGKLVAEDKQTVDVAEDSGETVKFQLKVNTPQLWSPKSPYLYRAVICVKNNKCKTTDLPVPRFGVRTLEFSADKGFQLNGKRIGTKPTSATFWAGFTVPYEAGALKAVEYDGTKEVG